MASIINFCDCSSNGLPLYRPCVPAPGANCVWNYGDKSCLGFPSNPTQQHEDTIGGCSSFDKIATLRRIQNQARVSESQYLESVEAVTVAADILNFKGSSKDFTNMRSSVWGNPNNLRNQSDRSTPSRSGMWTTSGARNVSFGTSIGMPGYVNVPTRGNSTRSTITANKPGAMTPGGEGVDVKHGSYHRYLAKKKGLLLTKPSVTSSTPPIPLIPLRQNPNAENNINNSAGMNNMVYKFSLVSTTGKEGQGCIDCSNSNLTAQPFPVL
jgi:hypothetical protein